MGFLLFGTSFRSPQVQNPCQGEKGRNPLQSVLISLENPILRPKWGTPQAARGGHGPPTSSSPFHGIEKMGQSLPERKMAIFTPMLIQPTFGLSQEVRP